MSKNKTILILCDWFLPGFKAGGPIQSIATLTQYLAPHFHFKIITTDRDFKSNQPYSNVIINEWTEYEGREVFYVSPENLNSTFILKLIQTTPHDVIYLNSLFSKIFTIQPLRWRKQGKLTSKIVLAPRGMLGEGALTIKPLKKKVFLGLAKFLGFFSDVIWQSTSEQETNEIKNRIGSRENIFQIPNFPKNFSQEQIIVKNEGELKLCFISRISEKKNLLYALDILSHTLKRKQIHFDIYGPIEDNEYWEKCKRYGLKELNIEYKGVLKPKEIANAFSQYHALFLPTLNENFGHVIVEALQQSRPVIISDNTPWRQLKEFKAGFDISLNEPHKFIEAINLMLAMNQAEYNQWSQASQKYIQSQLNIDDIKQRYINLFNQ